jgi:hypothetical protein
MPLRVSVELKAILIFSWDSAFPKGMASKIRKRAKNDPG